MLGDLEGKTLEGLKAFKLQLERDIAVMDEMRISQIDSAVNAAGQAAKELTSERNIHIRADINSRFQGSLDDLHIRLAACQKRIDLTQNQDRID